MDFNNIKDIAPDDYDSAKLDLLKLEAIICDGGKISDEAKAMISNEGFVGSTPTLKTVIAGINRDYKNGAFKMTPQQIKANAPNGSTHYDKMDYWKKDGDSWYIWLESCEQWRRIFKYQKFHDAFPIKPL